MANKSIVSQNSFSVEVALDLIKSKEPYPITALEAMSWLGKTNRQYGKVRAQISQYLKEQDFNTSAPPGGGDVLFIHSTRLSLGGFKHLAMIQRSELGYQVREHFIEAEERLQKLQKRQLNAELQATRLEGKITRREFTDTLKVLLAHALAQGSENYKSKPGLIYSQYSKMINAALFRLQGRFDNVRDILDARQLKQVKAIEDHLMHVVEDAIESSMHYKDIYQLAKVECAKMAAIFGISDVPQQAIEASPCYKQITN
jgi:phage anti-repressor protein